MRATLVVVIAFASGCDIVYDLTRPPPPPDAPSDRDSDGVIDGDDNCPDVANPGQENGDADPTGDACERCPGVDDSHHDEDDDVVDDACDNCPHLANADQRNTDSDDLGDACDPGPRIDCVLMFDPFVTMPAGTPLGTWEIQNDGLVQTDKTFIGGLFKFPEAYTTPRIVTRFRVEDFDPQPAAAQHAAGIYVALSGLGASPDAPAGIVTTTVYSTEAASVELRTTHINASSVTDVRASDLLAPNTIWTKGATTDITVDMQSTTMLFATATLGTSTASFDADFPPRQASNPIGLRAFQTHARFEYILISQQQSALPCP